MSSARISFAIAAFVAVMAAASAARADCASLLSRFNAALQARNLETIKTIEAEIAVDAACGERLTEVQRRRAALELLFAQDLIDKKAPPREYEALILNADKPDVLWRAAVMRGDLQFAQRKFGEATIAYERAIEIIKNPSKTPSSPLESVIAQVVSRAAEARMLAANDEGTQPTYVAAAKDHRDGTIGGAMSENIRGFKPVAVPLPIRFITGSAKFSEVGAQAAKELLTVLKEQQPGEIVLIGHTDERGDASYNMRLSQERAKAVANYLASNGIKAKIVTQGKGKSEPIALSNTTGLSREDIWSLNRRVVFERR